MLQCFHRLQTLGHSAQPSLIQHAILTKGKLGEELIGEIVCMMRWQTDNHFWHLGSNELKRYFSSTAKT